MAFDEPHPAGHVVERSGYPLLVSDPINVRVRRRFTQAFMRYDIDKLQGVRYQPQGLTEQDRELARYFQWLTTLPLSEYEDPPR